MQSHKFSRTFSPTTPPRIFVFVVLSIALNILPWRLRPASPALLIYALKDALLPLIVSPFLLVTWTAAIARILQLAWVVTHPRSPHLSSSYMAGAYAMLLAARCGSGFLFSRSVGWKYPQLFSHTALYEPVLGIGPLLAGTLLFDDVQDKRHLLARLGVLASCAVMEGAPWSYMCGAAVAGIYRLAETFTLDAKGLPWPISTSSVEQPRTFGAHIVVYTILAMLVGAFAGNLPSTLFPEHPLTETPIMPGVHVVMLTVPRVRDLASDVMIETISSYAEPWEAQLDSDVASNTTLTVFAHLGSDGTHPAFERARAHFYSSGLPITFYVQPMDVDGLVMNHHLHLADAMEYAYRKGHEWTMFVEDDFQLCGQWGWANLMRVLARLQDPLESRLNGAFVGTGGRYDSPSQISARC